MATTDLTQFGKLMLQPEALYGQVLYKRSLLGLGTIPTDWNGGKMYENAQKEIIKVDFNDFQIVESTLSDTNVRTFGISYDTEQINIRPYLVAVRRNLFAENSFDKALPMAITELNRVLDVHQWGKLKSLAKSGSSHAWSGPTDFIGWILGVLSDPILSDLRKHLVIPEKIRAELLGNIVNPEHRSWYAALASRLAEVNCDMITMKAADRVLLVVEPFLMEYTGMEPHVDSVGVNEEEKYGWMNLGFSASQFVVRDPIGLQSFEITGLSAYGLRITPDLQARQTKGNKNRVTAGASDDADIVTESRGG